MSQLIMVRHGQSQWNLENRFTGWVDVPLTEKGQQEAKKAGELLLNNKIEFDYVFSSVLQRANRTMEIILQVTGQESLPIEKHWRLNERHYGGLQGLNKKETAEKYGDEQVFRWRRSYDTLPPVAEGPLQDEMMSDPRYSEIDEKDFPRGEALKQTVERVLPYWENVMCPKVIEGKTLLVVAHGNSLRALVKHLSRMDEEEITQFEFSTGVPLVCRLDENQHISTMDFLI